MRFFLFVFSLLFIQLIADDTAVDDTETCCGNSPRPYRITMRHLESKGLGYNQGYSTLEGFLAPFEPCNDVWVPFFDLRAHFFNNGNPAANAGVGVRYIASRVWGVNAYYDYRKSKRLNFNQIGLGFESLGQLWDFRMNGYAPVGAKQTGYYDTQFSNFEGNSIIIARKRKSAMAGLNAEVGIHVDQIDYAPIFEDFPWYFAAGPYYYTGNGARTTWGGEGRIAVDLTEYVRIEGNTSYDHLFKWIVQGQLSVNIPLGRKKGVRQTDPACCSNALTLQARAYQRVDRNEIIVLDRRTIRQPAVDPLTGDPYVVWFVNNLSHSDGTFESPFNTLAAAEGASSNNDIIYVFPGDGTATGMDTGIVLKPNQLLLGAANIHILSTTSGVITIPTFDTLAPEIDNSGATSTVVLANNSVVDGFTIDDSNSSGNISSANATNCTISNNTLNVTVATSGSIAGISGPFTGATIINNIFNPMVSSSNAIDLASSSGSIVIDSNTFSFNQTSSFNFGSCIQNSANPANDIAIDIESNVFYLPNAAINLENSGSPAMNVFCAGNLAVMAVSGGTYGVLLTENGAATGAFTFDLEGNVVIQPLGSTIPSYYLNNVTANPFLMSGAIGPDNVGLIEGNNFILD